VTTEIEFCLLGPLTVRWAGAVVPVPPGKQCVVLAALLLNSRRVVSLDDLAETIWGQDPPPTARVGVQNYVMRLRKALSVTGRGLITTQPGGYVISIEPGELDVTRFEALLDTARVAAQHGSWETSAGHACAALALWRGEPLTGVKSDSLELREVPRLAEMRLQALETRIDSDLHLGRHREVIAELQRLVNVYPLREHLHALLMVALYHDGRQGEALAAYRRARLMLVEELGAEPGRLLRDLHEKILAGDPAVIVASPPKWGEESARAGLAAGPAATLGAAVSFTAGPADAAVAKVDPVVVPRQLPAAVTHFAGRQPELKVLSDLLSFRAGSAGAVVISAIGGMAGIGKTALAVQWAHQVAGRFPDGQLYVNLRGYDPDQPVSPADALAGFLRSLGVPGQDIPADLDERAARYRSLLAGRKVLVVLDNAREVGQVRPLLPGTSGCVTVVTSRDSQAGLVAKDGAARLDLNLLPLADATGLLQNLIGERAACDPAATRTLAEVCGRLPLALRVAAELAAAQSAMPVAELVGALADERRRLELLEAGADPRAMVRTVFSWSYRQLDPYAARAFRLAGLHPGPDFDCYAMAALTDTTVERADHVLGVLARAYLIQPTGPSRYGLHDLLRSYSRELAAVHEGHDEARAALTRLLDLYLSTSATAMDNLYPAERIHRPRVPEPAIPVPAVAGEIAARKWLDAERANLVAVSAHAAGNGSPGHATRLSATLFRYLDADGYFAEAVAIHGHARHAAARAGDRGGEATALLNLGIVDYRQDRYQQAADYLQGALALFREAREQTGEARALSNLGMIDYQQGRFRQAADRYQQALDLFRATGDRTGEARIRTHLGLIDVRQGRYRQAAGQLRQALAVSGETGDRLIEAYASAHLGEVEFRQGHYRQAAVRLWHALAVCRETGYGSVEAYALGQLGLIDTQRRQYPQATAAIEQALALYRRNGDREGEADELANLGLINLRQGRHRQAAGHYQQALALFRDIGELAGEARALNGLGEVCLASGRPEQARRRHAAALRIASETGVMYERACACNGLGNAHHALGEHGQAHRNWQEAFGLYAELGVPEIERVRAQLGHDR
jgi:DNA-binding SARP family transcriptional activator/Tfp pilus assembly protein PilF